MAREGFRGFYRGAGDGFVVSLRMLLTLRRHSQRGIHIPLERARVHVQPSLSDNGGRHCIDRRAVKVLVMPVGAPDC